MKDISCTSFFNSVELMTLEAEWIGVRLMIESKDGKHCYLDLDIKSSYNL
jgi:hypothetical protein